MLSTTSPEITSSPTTRSNELETTTESVSVSWQQSILLDKITSKSPNFLAHDLVIVETLPTTEGTTSEMTETTMAQTITTSEIPETTIASTLTASGMRESTIAPTSERTTTTRVIERAQTTKRKTSPTRKGTTRTTTYVTRHTTQAATHRPLTEVTKRREQEKLTDKRKPTVTTETREGREKTTQQTTEISSTATIVPPTTDAPSTATTRGTTLFNDLELTKAQEQVTTNQNL